MRASGPPKSSGNHWKILERCRRWFFEVDAVAGGVVEEAAHDVIEGGVDIVGGVGAVVQGGTAVGGADDGGVDAGVLEGDADEVVGELVEGQAAAGEGDVVFLEHAEAVLGDAVVGVEAFDDQADHGGVVEVEVEGELFGAGLGGEGVGVEVVDGVEVGAEGVVVVLAEHEVVDAGGANVGAEDAVVVVVVDEGGMLGGGAGGGGGQG